jgi:hypothetical protein
MICDRRCSGRLDWVAMAPLVSDPAARVEADRTFEGLAAEIPALLQRFGYGASLLLRNRPLI